MAKYHHDEQVPHQRVVFSQISAHGSGAVVFLRNGVYLQRHTVQTQLITT